MAHCRRPIAFNVNFGKQAVSASTHETHVAGRTCVVAERASQQLYPLRDGLTADHPSLPDPSQECLLVEHGGRRLDQCQQ